MKFDPKHSAAGMYGPAAAAPDDLPELRAWLTNNCETVAEALLGPPNQALSKKGRQLRWGAGGGLSLELKGAKRGQWFDHSAGAGGDILNLIARERHCDFPAAAAYVRERMGRNPQRVARAAPAPAKSTPATEAVAQAKKLAKAQALFDEGLPIAGTQGEAYFAARGITHPACAVLRFHPNLADSDKKQHPGIVAPITMPDGTLRTVHRTYLDREGNATKAGSAQAKNTRELCGSPGAGGVWLARGGDTVIVGEGIETTLSGLQAMPDAAAVAAISTAGLKNLALHEVRRVVLLVDVDKPGDDGMGPGEKAARTAAARWAAEGKEVWLVFPGPRDGPKIDMNDLLMRGGVDAVRAAIDAAEVIPSTSLDHASALTEAAYDVATEAEANLPHGVSYPDNLFKEIEPLPKGEPLAVAEARLAGIVAVAIEQGARFGVWRGLKEHARREAHTELKRAQQGLPPYHPLRADKGSKFQFLKANRRLALAGYRAALAAAGWNPDTKAPPTQVIKATVGIGKTHHVVQEIARMVRDGVPPAVPFLVVWLVSSHADAEQAKAKFEAAGVPAVVLAGRDRDRPDRSGKMCNLIDHNPNLTAELSRSGVSFSGSLCKSNGSKCQFANTCGWMTQAEAIPRRGVVIATHDVLADPKFGLPGGAKIEKIAALTICDENPGRLVKDAQHSALAVDVVEQWSRSAAPEFEPLREVLTAIARVLRLPGGGGDTWRAELQTGRVTLDVLEAGADGLRRHLGRVLAGVVGDGTAALRVLRKAGEHRRAVMRACELLEALAVDWRRAGGGPIQTVVLRDGAPDASGVRHRTWLALPVLRPVTLRPLIVLDASASEAVSARMFGADRTFHEIRAQQHLHVTFVPEPSFSYGNIGIGLWHGDASDGEGRRAWEQAAAKKTAAVVAWIGRLMVYVVPRHGAGKVGLITPKKIADMMRAAGARDCYRVMHFNNLRGRNDLEDCSCVVVLSRPLPGRTLMERDARSVFALDDAPLTHLIAVDADGREAGRYPRASQPIYLARGGHLWFNGYMAHTDPRVDALLAAACDEELAQAIGRLRAVRATPEHPKEVIILSDRPPSLAVHDLVSLDVLEGLLAVDSALHAEGRRAVLLTGQGLAQGAPDALLKADGTARQERSASDHADTVAGHAIARLARFRLGGGVTQNPYKNISTSSFAAPTPLGGFVSKSDQNGKISERFAIGRLWVTERDYLSTTALGRGVVLHYEPDMACAVADCFKRRDAAAGEWSDALEELVRYCLKTPADRVTEQKMAEFLIAVASGEAGLVQALARTERKRREAMWRDEPPKFGSAFEASAPSGIALLGILFDILDPFVVEIGGRLAWRNSIEADRRAVGARDVARWFRNGDLWGSLPAPMMGSPAARLLASEAAMIHPLADVA